MLYFLKKTDNLGLFFVYFRSFQSQFYIKTAGFRGIRTRIVGKHADHLTTTRVTSSCAIFGLFLKDKFWLRSFKHTRIWSHGFQYKLLKVF